MTARGQIGVVAAVLVAVALVTLTVMRALGSEITPIGVGNRAPDFKATTLDVRPRPRTLADYRGQVVLVNVWATWCEPCRVEIPSLERLYKTYGPKGLKIVAISIDDPGTDPAIRDFATKMGMTFDVLHDSTGAVQRTYQTTGIPETMVVGRDGVIRRKIAAASDWDSEGNRRLIEQLLAE